MADRPRATVMRYALIVSVLVNALGVLLWTWEHGALTSTREENAALTAELSRLKDAVSANRKAAEDDKDALKLARECQAANADLERRNRSLAEDVSALRKSLTAVEKELVHLKAAAAESAGAANSHKIRDEEAGSLAAEIAELQKAVAASQNEREESRESREQQLNDIRERTVRLLEEIRQLTAEKNGRGR